MKISVIIPAYNEEKGIESTIKRIPKEVFEIIVVDNNSADKTAEIAKKLGAKVIKETKQGYGYALQKGFKTAQGDIIVTLDADGQYPGEKILELVDYLIKNDLDFLNCSRFPLQNKNSLPFTRILGNYFLTFLTKILFGLKTNDSQSGMMIFKKEILNKIKLESGDMPLSQELKIKTYLAGFKYGEVNIPYYPRQGESKLFPLKHGIKNSKSLIELKLKHLHPLFLPIVSLIFIIFIYSFLASFNLNKQFINVTSDVNGENGLAVINWLNAGIFNLKLGKYVNGYLENKDSLKQINPKDFYTHHPVFYLLPTYFLYKIFGISEITTRGGIFLMFLISIIFLFFALQKIFNNLFYSFLTTLIFILLPGTVYYGTTFELAVFSLPTALITFSLFIFYYFSKKQIYFYFLLASIFLGGSMGWFYFFMPASIWVYLLFDKNKNFIKERKILLITLPLVSTLIFSFNLLHIYLLKRTYGFQDLKEAFLYRSQRAPFYNWLQVIYMRMQLNFNDLFLWLGVLGFFLYFLVYFKKCKIISPLFLMPIFNTMVFYQWSTHPFGVVFFLPIVAIFVSLFLIFIYERFKTYGLIFALLIILIGGIFSYKRLDYFINKFLILGPNDVATLKNLKNQVNNNEICLGQNQMGLYYGGIVMWYLRKNIYFSPDCLDDVNKFKNLKLAIIFNPQLGQFYLDEANKFISKGFKPIGCSDLWCYLSKQ
ncbi:putative glycosyltransferase [bacterium HR35]|nr:putative glycosyltransferase [bacterium HR35]